MSIDRQGRLMPLLEEMSELVKKLDDLSLPELTSLRNILDESPSGTKGKIEAMVDAYCEARR